MEKREKIFIIITTLIILATIFIAFIISNSQKLPPEIVVQNLDGKTSIAIMGGYEWKVFGNMTKTDAIDLNEVEYSLDNTIVSKTAETITLSANEKFTLERVEYVTNVSDEVFEPSARLSETGDFFTIVSPELEGTYICLFKLSFYDKGSAEYGVKIVVTDDNIYDVETVVDYRNTSLTDIVKIKELLGNLPYSNENSGIMVDDFSETKSLIVKYNNESINKEDLFNNTVALFALIPNLDSVIYEIGNMSETVIYYSRDEVNRLVSRDVLEYAYDIELWTKEVIYEEKESYNNDITMYVSTITTMLSKLSEKEIGEYVAIDIMKKDASGELETSGDVVLDEYDVRTLLRELNKEYELVLNVNSDEFENDKGTVVNVEITEDIENEYLINVLLSTSNGKTLEETYRAIKENGTIMINENEEILTSSSGDEI